MCSENKFQPNKTKQRKAHWKKLKIKKIVNQFTFCKLQFTCFVNYNLRLVGWFKQNLHEFYSLEWPCKSPVKDNLQINFNI